MKGFAGATGSRRRSPRMEDLVDMAEWPKGDFKRYRMIGPVYSICQIWFTIKTQQKEKQPIPKMCLDHDGENDKFVSDDCPYRKSGLGREGKRYYINVIDRELQEDSNGRVQKFPVPSGLKPETHLGHKAYWAKKGDSRRTPCRILEIPDSCVATLQNLAKLNKAKSEDGSTRTYDLSDVRYGRDIEIMIDENKKGAAKFVIQKGESTPLTKEERMYMLYRPDLLKADRLEEAKREMKDLEGKIVEDDRKPSSKKGRSRDEDEEDERPARNSRDARGSKGRGRSREDEDEDVDDEMVEIDDEDLEDEEDERPAKKKAVKPASKKRPRDDEDEDEDEEGDDLDDLDSDDEDEEDERPAKKKPAAKKRFRDEEEDEDDLDDLDADEEDERPAKKGRGTAKKSRDEDDLDDLDSIDEDEEDEEEDERPAKGRSPRRR